MTLDDLRPPKVAIVVPVYNPGPYLADCVESVLAQTMPPGELEAVFVDDGSTDGSGATLDGLAAAHPHIRVIHEPPSGWAGRPRNVGMDAATADYVLFLDHDDRLGPEAAQRLYDRATSDGSDVVLGRSVGHGRPNSSQLIWRTRGPVRFEDDPELVSHLKPHKLIRRAFLVEHDIRFPEGKVRLEDQVFVLQAYFLARGISVVGDYVCYHHQRRADRGNAVSTPWEPAFYYKYVRADLDVIERYTTPGPIRNRLLRRFVGGEMFGRLTGRKFLAASPQRRAALLAEIRSILVDYVPPEVDEELIPPLRTIAALARADRLDLLEAYARAASRTGPKAVAATATWLPAQGLELVIDVSLRPAADGIGFAPEAPDGWRLRLPAAIAAAVPPAYLSTAASIRRVVDVTVIDAGDITTSLTADVEFVRGPGSGDRVDWRLRVRAVLPFDVALGPTPGVSYRLRFQVQFRVTPERLRIPVTIASTRALGPYRAPEGAANDPTGGVMLTPSRSVGGRLVIDAGEVHRPPVRRRVAHAVRGVERRVGRVLARAR